MSFLPVLFIIVVAAVALPIDDKAIEDEPLDIDDFVRGDEIDIETEIPDGQDPLNDAIENGNGYEGDIMLTQEQASIIINGTEDDLISMRSSIRENHWPKKGANVYIPYTMTGKFSKTERSNIARAMAEYEKNTCIRIIPRTTEKDYVGVYRGTGCHSQLGKRGGKQPLSLAKGCASTVGTPVHEFMHAIGYWHEQMRSDRDSYVKIIWENIEKGRKGQFEICKSCDNQGLKYDVKSVMHYHAFSFSKTKGKPTIELLDGSTRGIGQRNGFSALDIKGINKLYCQGKIPTPSGCSDKKKVCTARKTKGYCTQGKFVGWMAQNCKKSCGKCCHDLNSKCSSWAKSGNCTKNKYRVYMETNCKKSCRKCS